MLPGCRKRLAFFVRAPALQDSARRTISPPTARRASPTLKCAMAMRAVHPRRGKSPVRHADEIGRSSGRDRGHPARPRNSVAWSTDTSPQAGPPHALTSCPALVKPCCPDGERRRRAAPGEAAAGAASASRIHRSQSASSESSVLEPADLTDERGLKRPRSSSHRARRSAQAAPRPLVSGSGAGESQAHPSVASLTTAGSTVCPAGARGSAGHVQPPAWELGGCPDIIVVEERRPGSPSGLQRPDSVQAATPRRSALPEDPDPRIGQTRASSSAVSSFEQSSTTIHLEVAGTSWHARRPR